MKACEHSALVHYHGMKICYWCATVVVRSRDSEGVTAFDDPTPRDLVDAFIATLKGVAR